MLRKPSAPFLIGHRELAQMLAISTADALYLCEVNAIRCSKIGNTNRYRILVKHVEEFIETVHDECFGGIANNKTGKWIFAPQTTLSISCNSTLRSSQKSVLAVTPPPPLPNLCTAQQERINALVADVITRNTRP